MSRNLCLGSILIILLLPGLAYAGDGVSWSKDLSSGLAKAKETGKIVMICINAKYVEGRQKEERAAKGLREVVYLDPRIVEKSRDFICVFLTPKSGHSDYSELGALGIGGQIVSPQHIFVNSEGDKVLIRKKYWPYGKGEKAVEALLRLMEKAEKKSSEANEPAEPEGEIEAAPTQGEERARWIASMLALVKDEIEERRRALRALIEADEDGDCTDPLIALLKESKKDIGLAQALIRTLGIDGLEAAAKPISGYLGHKEDTIRANAAVSLEYIGSTDRKVVSALQKHATRQKDAAIANHMYRALGRCGAKDAKARGLLLKMAASGKSEFSTYGPAIGLAYFEDDEKAMRGVEQLLKLIGIPGGRRGGGQNTVKRGLMSWTLACIGNEKSEKFVREELIARMKNVKAFWVGSLTDFWESVALKCGGDDSQMAGIESEVKEFVGFAKRFDLSRYGAETGSLMDESRTGRDNSDFTPRGDNLLDSGDGD